MTVKCDFCGGATDEFHVDCAQNVIKLTRVLKNLKNFLMTII